MALTGEIAGDIQFGPMLISAYLWEGNITPGTARSLTGLKRDVVAYQYEITEGDIVEFFDDEAITSGACKNLPVVRTISGTGAKYLARVREIIEAEDVPADQVTTLANALAGNYLRKATIEVFGMVGMTQIEVTVGANGGGADSIDIADPTTLVLDVSGKNWKFGTGTGTELVPLHHVEGSTSVAVVDSIQVGVGMKKVELVA